MRDIIIRKMDVDDVPSVAAIERSSFSMPWSEDGFKDSLKLDYALFLVAVDKDKPDVVLGYIGLYMVACEADITNVAVSSGARGQGVGKSLVLAVKDYCVNHHINRINLEVRVSNEVAVGLYEKCGFEKTGIRKNFYSRPVEDGLLMSFTTD